MDSDFNYDNNTIKSLRNSFENNIKLSLKTTDKVFIITKKDIFYGLDIYSENIQLFLSSNNSIIDRMVANELS
jgi:hypothetical protein